VEAFGLYHLKVKEDGTAFGDPEFLCQIFGWVDIQAELLLWNPKH
jgi:hypothetical protein